MSSGKSAMAADGSGVLISIDLSRGTSQETPSVERLPSDDILDDAFSKDPARFKNTLEHTKVLVKVNEVIQMDDESLSIENIDKIFDRFPGLSEEMTQTKVSEVLQERHDLIVKHLERIHERYPIFTDPFYESKAQRDLWIDQYEVRSKEFRSKLHDMIDKMRENVEILRDRLSYVQDNLRVSRVSVEQELRGTASSGVVKDFKASLRRMDKMNAALKKNRKLREDAMLLLEQLALEKSGDEDAESGGIEESEEGDSEDPESGVQSDESEATTVILAGPH